MNRRTAEAVQYLGVALVAGGVGLFSIAAGLIVLGIALIVLSQIPARTTDREVV